MAIIDISVKVKGGSDTSVKPVRVMQAAASLKGQAASGAGKKKGA